MHRTKLHSWYSISSRGGWIRAVFDQLRPTPTHPNSAGFTDTSHFYVISYGRWQIMLIESGCTWDRAGIRRFMSQSPSKTLSNHIKKRREYKGKKKQKTKQGRQREGMRASGLNFNKITFNFHNP
ncbi:hypothetical protein PoB_006077300 [Plakobranchus ocellatus]|uniref:Uncharacterized protein n=1 Tax=Plakobranchus ocellatus TaxID=259542 RepID=A0AAV4CQU6_9GAST|nr:hypothetical protein PoB_006077300 [Plakobranchus ocellatus]